MFSDTSLYHHAPRRHAWHQLDTVKKLLQKEMSGSTEGLIDWDTLQLERERGTGEGFNRRVTDHLFSAQLKDGSNTLYGHLSVEYHQLDECIMPLKSLITPFTMVYSCHKIMERHKKRYQTETLPPIIPLVVFEHPYNDEVIAKLIKRYPENIRNFATMTWHQPLDLTEVTQQANEKFKHFQWITARLMGSKESMKHHDSNLPGFMAVMEQLNDQQPNHTVIEYMRSTAVHLMEFIRVSEQIDFNKLVQSGQDFDQAQSDRSPEDVQNHKLKKVPAIAVDMLNEGLDPASIASLLNVPIDDVIECQDDTRLRGQQ